MQVLRETWYLYVRHIRATLRLPVWIVVSLTQPVLWLVLYGQLFRQVVDIPGFGAHSYIQFLTPGVVIMSTLFGSAWAGMGMLEDMRVSILERLLTTPVHRSAIIFARVMQSATTTTVQALIILGLGVLLGARVDLGFWGGCLILLAGLLLGATFAALSNGLALLVKKEESLIAAVNFVSLPLTFLSAALMSVLLMPQWMREMAQINPVNWAVLAARGAMSAQLVGGIGWNLIKLGMLLVISTGFATWSFSRYRKTT